MSNARNTTKAIEFRHESGDRIIVALGCDLLINIDCKSMRPCELAPALAAKTTAVAALNMRRVKDPMDEVRPSLSYLFAPLYEIYGRGSRGVNETEPEWMMSLIEIAREEIGGDSGMCIQGNDRGAAHWAAIGKGNGLSFDMDQLSAAALIAIGADEVKGGADNG